MPSDDGDDRAAMPVTLKRMTILRRAPKNNIISFDNVIHIGRAAMAHLSIMSIILRGRAAAGAINRDDKMAPRAVSTESRALRRHIEINSRCDYDCAISPLMITIPAGRYDISQHRISARQAWLHHQRQSAPPTPTNFSLTRPVIRR